MAKQSKLENIISKDDLEMGFMALYIGKDIKKACESDGQIYRGYKDQPIGWKEALDTYYQNNISKDESSDPNYRKIQLKFAQAQKKLTIENYIQFAQSLGVDPTIYSGLFAKESKKYLKGNYFESIKQLIKKVQEGKATEDEKRFYYKLEGLTREVAEKLKNKVRNEAKKLSTGYQELIDKLRSSDKPKDKELYSNYLKSVKKLEDEEKTQEKEEEQEQEFLSKLHPNYK